MKSLESTAAERNSLSENLTTEPHDREWWDAESRLSTDWPTIVQQRQDALRLMATECPTCRVSPCRDADQPKAGRSNLPDHIPANWDDKSVSLEALWSRFNERRHSTPQSIVEAIMFCIRQRGIAALKEAANIERLSRCNGWARRGIDKRTKKRNGGGSDNG